ncbi:MAG: SUMF1/EgtB/PvdO family nonheme iron enzyme, partial [Anaerolineales bacterium]|nr:SUMF1/EgtB/PvdO family nonheme iron enzyme [Anaerolineales bacterium]
KPSNILINKRGQAILTDFGLALLDSTRTRGDVFGSPHYIAPEQAISSAGAVPQSDFYALGAMLYEMVTGEKPFDGDNPLAIAMMHASDPPPPPRQIEPSISPALESVILRSLAKEPANRYADGEAFIAALKQAIQRPDAAPSNGRSGGSPSRPLPPLPAAVATESIIKTAEAPDVGHGRKKSRRRGRRVLLFLLLLLALGASGVALYQIDANTKTMVDNLLIQNGLMSPPLPTMTPTETATAATEVAEAALPTETVTSVPTAEPTAAPTDASTETPSSTVTSTPTAAPTATRTPSAAEPTPNPFPPLVTRETDGMPMRLIPAGTFMMGAAATDALAEADEQPAHEVTLNSFYIDQYEVSVGQYVVFLNEEVGFYQYEDACFNLPCLGTQFEGFDSFITDANGQHIGQGDSEERPVNVIRWQGAAAYCAWVGGRLPTEAEWEYAARGETTNLYPWGDEAPDETRAVFGNTDIGFRYIFEIEAVDALPEGASPFGVYGLAGGVAEWTADVYAADFYANSPAVNPTNTSETTAEAYVVRGGAWNSPAEDLRTTARTGVAPTSDDKAIGFRCAFDPANAIP